MKYIQPTKSYSKHEYCKHVLFKWQECSLLSWVECTKLKTVLNYDFRKLLKNRYCKRNKDENAHRYAVRGKKDRERDREKE